MQTIETFPAEFLILIFLSITFFFSGLEKIFGWKESLLFYTDHFKDTFIRNRIFPLLIFIIISEMICGLFSVIGIIQIIDQANRTIGLFATIISAIVLLIMLVGQRIAKDYAGAMNITVYFILTVIGVFLMSKPV